jgi:chromosome segregation ATPase
MAPLESQLVTSRAEVERARKESTDTRAELSAALEAQAGLEDAMAQQQVEAAQLQAELSAALEAQAGLEDTMAQQQVEAAQLRAELSAALEAQAGLEDAVAQQQVEAAQLRAELEATGTEESNHLAAEASRELVALHEKLADQERELDALAAQYEKISRRAERHKSKSVKAQNEQKRLQDEGAALSFALGKTKSDLVEAQHALLEQAAAFADGEQELAKLQRAHQQVRQDLQQQQELTQRHMEARDAILAEAERAQTVLRAELLDAQSRAKEDVAASESQLNNIRADAEAQRLSSAEELREERSQCQALREKITGMEEQVAALHNRLAAEALAADKRQAQLQQTLDDRSGALNRACSDADTAAALAAKHRSEIARLEKHLEAAKAEAVAERSRCGAVQEKREEEVAQMQAEIEGGPKPLYQRCSCVARGHMTVSDN